MVKINFKKEEDFENFLESFKDTQIERIELIDLLSPPNRNAGDMAKLLGLTEKDERTKQISQPRLKKFFSPSFNNFRKSFGLGDVAFKDLVEKYDVDDEIQTKTPHRSLSFSLKGGLHGSWAPNGYGKTFAISNILCVLQQSVGSSPLDKFNNFLDLTRNELKEGNRNNRLFNDGWHSTSSGKWQVSTNLSDQRDNTPKLIPFRQINYLLSNGIIICINLNFSEGIYSDFDLKITKVAKNFEDSFVIDDVKFPVWLSGKGAEVYFDNSEGMSFIEKKIFNMCLITLTNLKVEYIEIPRLCYQNHTLNGISEQFIHYFSTLESRYRFFSNAVNSSLNRRKGHTMKELFSKSNSIKKYNRVTKELNSLRNQLDDSIGSKALSEIEKTISLNKEEFMVSPRRFIATIDHKFGTYSSKESVEELQDRLADLESAISNRRGKVPIEQYRVQIKELHEKIDFQYQSKNLNKFVQQLSFMFKESDNMAKISDIGSIFHDIERRFNSVINESSSPWDIEVKLLNWKHEPNGNVFRFDYRDSNESNLHRATWDTLSFGQKSNFILQSALILEEAINNEEPEWPLQRFTVIDEPEAGKAESWVSNLTSILRESNDRLSGRRASSIMILSHRGIVLDSISDDGTYSLLHNPGTIHEED